MGVSAVLVAVVVAAAASDDVVVVDCAKLYKVLSAVAILPLGADIAVACTLLLTAASESVLQYSGDDSELFV